MSFLSVWIFHSLEFTKLMVEVIIPAKQFFFVGFRDPQMIKSITFHDVSKFIYAQE